MSSGPADADANSPAEAVSGDLVLGGILARIGLGLFVLFLLILGAWVAGVGFHDPDSCWLLALGQHIWQHGGLPSTDPFSFTFALTPKPFVMYQWATELLLYAAYALAGLTGVLLLVAAADYVAFVVLPAVACERLGLARPQALGLIVLAWAAAAFHLLVRPEIFSYLLLSAWLTLMLTMRTTRSAGINWTLVVCFSATAAIWCNFHTGFTSGLVVLAVYVLALSAQSAMARAISRPLPTAVVSLICAVLGTLANPKGIGLWLYIPSLFFAPFNKFIDELRPLGFKDLSDPEWYPFLILAIITLVKLWRNRTRLRSEELADRADYLNSIAVSCVLIATSLSCRRLISFDALIFLYECAWLSRVAQGKPGIWAEADKKLKSIFDIDWRWALISGAVVLSGVVLIATGEKTKPRLPQPSVAFAYPSEVIAFMRAHPP